MTAFTGNVRVQIDADTNDEAATALERIARLSLGFPNVEKVAVTPPQKSTINVEEVRHA